jgi:AbrB family looped-hinge helix DNA binding protein
MRIWADGRVTIPARLRRETGLLPGVEVTVELDGDSVVVRPRHDHREADGAGSERRPSA